MKKGEERYGRNGETYVLVSKLGRGGQAEVWKVENKRTGELFAYKEYKKNTNNVKANIEELQAIGHMKDSDKKVLDSVVLPITLVDDVQNDRKPEGFGYIMELVDLKGYTTLKKAWMGNYPSCQALCRIVQNFAAFFDTLHIGYGMCYKDVNEGNIFFNSTTGDIKIIDNDNIGHASRYTIKGTNGYMAPEVILGAKPDSHTDKFSFAVYLYRLLTGSYPFEGPYTDAYCLKHDVLLSDLAVQKVLMGKKPIFVWHPTDTRNSIENSTDPKRQGQAQCWKSLPQSVRDLFIKTFVTNLSEDRRAERTTDLEWKQVFAQAEKDLVKCGHCGSMTFGDSTTCFSCGEKMKKRGKTSAPIPQPVSQTGHKHYTTFRFLSVGEKKRDVNVYVAEQYKGTQVSRNLSSSDLFKILYNKNARKMGIKNLSKSAWTIVMADKSKVTCGPGQIQILEPGMMIRIIPKTAQMNVLSVQ